jgi:hypothetical protein
VLPPRITPRSSAAARAKPSQAMVLSAPPVRRSRAGNELQIEKMVGRTMVVSGNTPMAQQGIQVLLATATVRMGARG